jgi:uncharacterized Zn finger protein
MWDTSSMADSSLTQETVRALVGETIFSRGAEYFRDGAVSGLVRRGDAVSAKVHGGDYAPYRVTVQLHDGGVADADCTCPYDWGGHCKHIVAVLLAFSQAPAAVEEQRPIIEVLRELDRETLVDLMLKRLESDPDLADWIEDELDVGAPDGPSGPEHERPAVDPAPIREQARLILSGRYRRQSYWDGYRSTGDDGALRRLVEKAVPFLEAGDGRNALRVLEPIAESFIEDWIEYCDHDEDMYLLFADLGGMMAEAVLMSDLAPEDRDDLATTLHAFQEQLDNYGVDDGFNVAIRALEVGWDEAGLREVMAGEGKVWPLAGSASEEDEELTGIRLRVLEACNQHEEYLNLARAANHLDSYANMLVKLDRIPEAVAFALTAFKQPNEALSLARTLRGAGAHDEALKIGEAGLRLGEVEGSGCAKSAALAHWLRDYAGAVGRSQLALAAGRTAFLCTFSLENYQAVRSWAGDLWHEIRPGLLERLAREPYASDRLKIYLSERMIDEAVRSVGDRHFIDLYDGTLMQLAEAAHASHSAWVIRLARTQADEIMNANKSQRYDTAARWLQTAGRAYRASGKTEEWTAELTALIEKHQRKYKLRPLLEALQRENHG